MLNVVEKGMAMELEIVEVAAKTRGIPSFERCLLAFQVNNFLDVKFVAIYDGLEERRQCFISCSAIPPQAPHMMQVYRCFLHLCSVWSVLSAIQFWNTGLLGCFYNMVVLGKQLVVCQTNYILALGKEDTAKHSCKDPRFFAVRRFDIIAASCI